PPFQLLTSSSSIIPKCGVSRHMLHAVKIGHATRIVQNERGTSPLLKLFDSSNRKCKWTLKGFYPGFQTFFLLSIRLFVFNKHKCKSANKHKQKPTPRQTKTRTNNKNYTNFEQKQS